jgi:tyrosinase
VRRDVWKLGEEPWNDVLLWYARGVDVLKRRPVTERNSWTFFGAMHGFDQDLWTAFDYLQPGAGLPPEADQEQFWRQCQHQTWYFLPWHRGYLAAFEAAVREAIAGLGGPSDWALPYWDYSDTKDPNALTFPPAFSLPTLPGGEPNPLVVKQRYGDGTGKIVIKEQDVGLNALKEPRFEGTTTGGSTGFGGVRTRFRHDGPRSANGRLERQPHNVVHGLIGGRLPDGDPEDARSYGLMSLPDTAALDPIFWLHHANIDRLWEVWLQRSALNRNPDVDAWLTGPSDRRFAVPLPDGTTWVFAATDVVDTQGPHLDYVYESTRDPFAGADLFASRAERLGAPAVATDRLDLEAHVSEPQSELLGANDETLRVEGDVVETRVRVDRDAVRRTMNTLDVAPQAAFARFEPDRVYLNLENVTGVNDAAVLYVYVSHPAVDASGTMVGAVSFFGVRKATAPDEAHGGNGINESLDVTDWVDEMRAAGVDDLDDIRVRLVPRTPIRPEDRISVGRVSLYRQGR